MERTSGRCLLRIEFAHGRNCNGRCWWYDNTAQEQVVSCRTSSWKLAPALVANQRPPCTTCGEIQPESLSAHPATPSPDPARQKPRREDGLFANHGIYLNGAQGKGVDSFKEWLTTQMFGMTTTGGSEIVYDLVQHSESQVFRSVLERVGLPIAPKPAIAGGSV